MKYLIFIFLCAGCSSVKLKCDCKNHKEIES